jgi:DMSO/TMAO reductase YedYZ molybdopterin-dependent catalytic subunit
MTSQVSAPQDPTKAPGAPTIAVGSRSQFVNAARAPTGAIAGSSFTPLQDLTGTITPSDLHFEVNHGGVPAIDPARHSLLVHGLVRRPLLFTLADIKRFPRVVRVCAIECAGNGSLAWGGGTFGKPDPGLTPQQVAGMTANTEWTGVSLRVLLAEAGISSRAKWILAEGGDSCLFARSIPIEKVMDDALLAWAQNGEPLRPSQGFSHALGAAWMGREHERQMAPPARARHSAVDDAVGNGHLHRPARERNRAAVQFRHGRQVDHHDACISGDAYAGMACHQRPRMERAWQDRTRRGEQRRRIIVA